MFSHGVLAPMLTFYKPIFFKYFCISLQLLAMDASARVTMKDAAKCDKRCEWQNSANQENAERNLRFLRLRGKHVCFRAMKLS